MAQTNSPIRLSRRRLLLSGALIGAAMLSPWAGGTTPASASAAAESYVASVARSVLAVAAGPQGQMNAKFRALMSQHAAIANIGIYSLGKYRNKLPAGSRAEYFSLIEKFVANLFVKYAPQFAGNKIEVTGSKARKATDIIVSSKVHFSNGQAPLEVDWRLLKTGGGFKIFDVRVLGVWLAFQQRSEFVSVIQKNNGDVGALMKFLRGG